MDNISYIEKRKHGTVVFPAQYYYVDQTHPRYVMNAHWHREFEIIRILSGGFTIYLNEKEFSLKGGDILFVECGCLHRGEPINCVYECIVVDLKMLLPQQADPIEQYISQITNSQVNIKNPLSPDEHDLYLTANTLFDTMSNARPYYELCVFGMLYTLISQLYSLDYISFAGCTQPSKQIRQISLIIDWINKNYKKEISSQTLSEISNLNFNYLCKIFKNFTGQTITQYVNEQRIEHACYDIIKNNKSITEAAINNGFNDLSYFSKTFKRHKGMTPRAFKSFTKGIEN